MHSRLKKFTSFVVPYAEKYIERIASKRIKHPVVSCPEQGDWGRGTLAFGSTLFLHSREQRQSSTA
jgi:hypothetical protein